MLGGRPDPSKDGTTHRRGSYASPLVKRCHHHQPRCDPSGPTRSVILVESGRNAIAHAEEAPFCHLSRSTAAYDRAKNGGSH